MHSLVTIPADLTHENIFGLAALHDYARRHGWYCSCERIQKEVARRVHDELRIIVQLNCYKPIKQSELFEKRA